MHCYRHCGNEYNLRAKIEDFLEIEKRRSGKHLARIDAPMSFADASRLLHSAIYIMRILGWAWRWAEWWVDFDSSWEPLLEPGQVEEEMSKEELKIVESTREQRCEDARRCRLAAFGAALRNRDYDTDDDFHREALDKALRAILHTKSLVGPMTTKEINFLVEWLARAYRSKSRLLYMGDNKSRLSTKSPFCFHAGKGGTPKFELLSRPLPGAGTLIEDSVFEAKVEEPDNFMRVKEQALKPRRSIKNSPADDKVNHEDRRSTTKKSSRRAGRPKKYKSPDKNQPPPTPPSQGHDRHSRSAEKPRGRPAKKRALEKSTRSLSPRQDTEDYLTRHFKTRPGRRTTVEARTAATKSEVKPAPAISRRGGRPPSKKRKTASEVETSPEVRDGGSKDDLQAVASMDNADAKDESSSVKVNIFETTLLPDSFDVVKGRNRRKTQPLNLEETSGKSYDASAETTNLSPTRRTPRRR